MADVGPYFFFNKNCQYFTTLFLRELGLEHSRHALEEDAVLFAAILDTAMTVMAVLALMAVVRHIVK